MSTAEVRDASFTVGERTVVAVHGQEEVVISGPRFERLAALTEWATAEGFVLLPATAPTLKHQPDALVHPFPVGTEVRHVAGWIGTVAGYQRNGDPIVRRSPSWSESCRATSLSAVEVTA